MQGSGHPQAPSSGDSPDPQPQPQPQPQQHLPQQMTVEALTIKVAQATRESEEFFALVTQSAEEVRGALAEEQGQMTSMLTCHPQLGESPPSPPPTPSVSFLLFFQPFCLLRRVVPIHINPSLYFILFFNSYIF